MNVYSQDGLQASGFGKHTSATHELHWDLNMDVLDPAECYEASQLDWTCFHQVRWACDVECTQAWT